MKRSIRWGIAAAVCLAAAAAALLVDIWIVEPAMLVTREVDLPLPEWPNELDGVSLLLISDPPFFRRRAEADEAAAHRCRSAETGSDPAARRLQPGEPTAGSGDE